MGDKAPTEWRGRALCKFRRTAYAMVFAIFRGERVRSNT